ncbi:hypothetical protein GCM10017044_05030 [Kordiimonas sediminis]|uniref:LCCL domain-containing protein n=1 Tax=Kordiimonas sediminis TaxID=1735581 RepID=A0A919E4W4_9PROT|nr:hypothetical protein [Kordiimonas sediminis]GHF13934.1 hypothetical protein GCM10017044_05030 [Kordiimonas sediminis]
MINKITGTSFDEKWGLIAGYTVNDDLKEKLTNDKDFISKYDSYISLLNEHKATVRPRRMRQKESYVISITAIDYASDIYAGRYNGQMVYDARSNFQTMAIHSGVLAPDETGIIRVTAQNPDGNKRGIKLEGVTQNDITGVGIPTRYFHTIELIAKRPY